MKKIEPDLSFLPDTYYNIYIYIYIYIYIIYIYIYIYIFECENISWKLFQYEK